MEFDLLERKKDFFVLWHSGVTYPLPQLVIGRFQCDNPPEFLELGHYNLHTLNDWPDLWGIPAAACNLTDGEVYHYWLEEEASNPYVSLHTCIWCTDPTAWTVDWRPSKRPITVTPPWG
jgi:pullulanase